MKKLTTHQFIEKARKIHYNKYGYSNVNYINCSTKISITCPIHGDFLQIPDNHLSRRSGCRSCRNEAVHNRCNKGLHQFITDANKIHKNKYDYSKSLYKTAHIKLEIICKKHGPFFQTPNGHLSGQGCLKCGNNTKTTDEFIVEASKIHNNRYNYDGINYVDLVSKMPILCNLHGKFYQTPYAHLKGQGCPKCKKSKGEIAIQNYLDVKGIIYEATKTFKSCINPKTGWNLYYDFYLPQKNILIEFDGYQHYQPYYRDKFNKETLKMRRYRDKLKDLWAKTNGIKLVRIKYTSIKRIPNILQKLV